MTTLDSRRMTYLNCFGQKFSKPGTYRYRITSSSTSGLDRDARFSIEVKPVASPAKVQQHDVAVRLEGRELVADPPFVSINAGDLVVWNTPDSSIAGYLIEGKGSGLSFSSARLTREAVYTHAFGVPGTYRWLDAHGGKLGGVIEVVSPKADAPESARKWLGSLGSPTLIRVRGEHADPKRVQILTGQTVAWAIEEAAGISVTDSSVVPDGAAKRG
jgi:plastocyanin